MIPEIFTHVIDAQARLLTQYQDAVLLNGFIQAIVSPIQEMEAIISQLNTLRSIYNAFGVQLDNLGTIVGIARVGGQSDASYLISILGQIGVNNSDGTNENVIAAFLTYTGGQAKCITHEYYPAQCYIETDFVFGSEAAELLAQAFIQSVVGISIYFSGFTFVDTVLNFAFDGPQVGNVSAGFGDVNDPSIGGFWSSELDPTVAT